MKRTLLLILISCLIVSPCVAEEIDVFWLVDRGTPAQLKEALDKGAKFNVKRSISDFDNLDDMDVNGWLCEYNETPLHRAAAYNKNPEVIKFLIEQGLDVNAEGYMGHSVITPLSCAVEKKNVEAIKELLKAGANSSVYISSRTPTPLHFIAVQYKNSPDDVKSMIEAIKNASGDVNVHTELSKEDEEEFAKYKTIFLPRNQWKSDDPIGNMRDFSNAATGNLLATLTPLMYAVLYDNTDVVNILLDVSADANIKSAEGKTALDYANELPDSSELKKSPAFEKLKAATTVKKAEVKSAPKDENFDRADKLVAEGKIPMYVRDKGKFFFNPDFEYGIVGINAQKVNLRSQPNTKANVVAQLSRGDTGKWPVYLGEWTHPNGEHWVLGEYHKNGLGNGKGTPVWIFGKYADPMTEEMYGIAAEGIAMEEAEKEREIIEAVRNNMYYSDFSPELGYGPVGRQLERFFGNPEWNIETTKHKDFEKNIAVFSGIARDEITKRRRKIVVRFGRAVQDTHRFKKGNLVLTQIDLGGEVIYRYFMSKSSSREPNAITQIREFQAALLGAVLDVDGSPNLITLTDFLEKIYSID